MTFARVAVLALTAGRELPQGCGQASELRILGQPDSVDTACAVIASAKALSNGVVVTGFSSADLLELVGHDHGALAKCAAILAKHGLAAVAETPIDRLGETDEATEVIRAVRQGGLGVWRLTVDRGTTSAAPESSSADLLRLIGRAEQVAAAVGGLYAFAPLPRHEPADTPSTGYDDVRTIAIARLMCRYLPSIQVDWSVYGPKLAQVAIAYGADDLDAVSPYEDPTAGPRRAPRADIERHIRAAFAEPAERTPSFEMRP